MIGDFNDWDPRANPMRGSDAGIWTVKVPEARQGSLYKYHVVSKHGNYRADKADPFAFRCGDAAAHRLDGVEARLRVGRRRVDADRGARNALDAPWSVYEVHLGSWRRDPSDPRRHPELRAKSPRCSPST